MAQTRILVLLAALAGSALSFSAQANDEPADADVVVAVRRFEVPLPHSTDLRLNTVQRPGPGPIVVRPVGGGVAQVVPVTPVTGRLMPSAGGTVLALEQPGLPAGAREDALRNGALPLQPVANSATAPVIPVSGVAGAVTSTGGDITKAGLPPPPVFQTMEQAASAVAVDRSIPSAIAPVAPEVRDMSLRGQALTLMMDYPMALPGFAVFLVFLMFLFKRSRVSHRSDDLNQ